VTSSYWLDEAFPPRPSVTVEDPDVVVVGAGVTGCAAALRLAQAGRRVRVYDSREVAGGASGRNGGFALRGMPAAFDVTTASVGEETARDLMAWTERAIDTIESLAGDAFRRVGSLRIAFDQEERDELRVEYEALVAAGFAAEWLELPELHAPGRFIAALRHVPDGVLQPARWVRRLAGLAAEAGVEIREYTPLTSLDEVGDATVVVCVDGYPSGLLGAIEGLVIPTRGQVIATEPISERLFDVPHYGRHGYDYWHQDEAGRIVAGGLRDVSFDTEFTADEALTEPVQDALHTFVNGLVGRDLRVDFAWAGIFGLVMDFLPTVGRAPGLDNVWVAGGYSGHGNVLGFACGELVADAVAGGDVPFLDVLDPARLLNAGA
jgi:gamma-glutamylputrescine oxidase